MKNYEEAEQDYMSGMTYKALAEKYGVSINTVKSWKARHNWNRKKKPHDGNQYAKGNKGNKKASAPRGNQNNKSHGLFAKYIPKETMDIINMIEEKSPADILWGQILLQYSAIIRAQEIMFVKDKDDTTMTVKSSGKGEEYDIAYSWDKYANFLTSLSRAQSELRNLVKQFKDIALDDDERLLKLEQMQLNIKKTKTEIENMGSGDGNDQVIIVNDVDEMRKVLDESNKDD